MGDKKKIIKTRVDNVMSAFFYYDRKEDDELPAGKLQEMVKSGDITVDEIVRMFETKIRNNLQAD